MALIIASLIIVLAIYASHLYLSSIKSGISKRQLFEISIITPNGSFPTVVSVFMWLPNGSIISLGTYIGESGTVELKTVPVLRAFKTWYDYLIKNGNDPKLINIGLIILATIHTPNGIYYVIRSIPINTYKIIHDETSIKITIHTKLTKRNLVINNKEDEKLMEVLVNRLLAGFVGKGILYRSESSYSKLVRQLLECHYVWRLAKVYVKTGVGIPLVAVHLYGNVSEVCGVSLMEEFIADESMGMKLGFDIMVAVRRLAGNVVYEISGPVVMLNRMWLSYKRTFFEGVNFTGESVLAIGIKADVAFVEYKLELCSYTVPICVDTGIVANMTLARPVVKNNTVMPWYEIDNDTHRGVASITFWYIAHYWNRSRNYVEKSALVLDMLTTEPSSGLMVVLPVLLGYRTSPRLATIAAVPIDQGCVTSVLLMLERPNYGARICANYYYSPAEVYYKGREIRLKILYVNARICAR